MLELANDVVGMSVSEDGLDAWIVDLRRGCRWSVAAAGRKLTYGEGDIRPLAAGSARVEGDATVVCAHRIDGGQVMFRWRLCDDHVELALEVAVEKSAGLTAVSLPGCIKTGESAGAELLVPIYQGALLRHTDRPLSVTRSAAGMRRLLWACLGSCSAVGLCWRHRMSLLTGRSCTAMARMGCMAGSGRIRAR